MDLLILCGAFVVYEYLLQLAFRRKNVDDLKHRVADCPYCNEHKTAKNGI